VVGEDVKMGARKVPAVSLAIFLLSVLPKSGPVPYYSGSGTPNDPYLIYTATEMNQIGLNFTDWNKNFMLMADINLDAYTGTQFSRIGTDDRHAFNGVFNGNGHTISNFTYTAPSSSYVGIFGHTSASARVEKVALVNVNVTGSEFIGGLVGYNEGTISDSSVAGAISGYSFVGGLTGYNFTGTISNCSSTGTVTGGDYSEYLGGLVGYSNGNIGNCFSTGATSGRVSSNYLGGLVGQSDGSISNCHSKGTVAGGDTSNYLGGLAGVNYGIISNSFSTAAVSGGSSAYCLGGLAGYNYNTVSACWAGSNVSGGASRRSVGGLVGEIGPPGVVSNCYATGEVSADHDVGGLVGMNDKGTITKCHSSGKVSGSEYAGGLLGWNNLGTISNSFWDTNSSTQSSSAGGIGKTTEQMKTYSTFADAGWDFNDIWSIREGINYPRFIWQILLGDIVCPGGVDIYDLTELCDEWLFEKIPADLAPLGGDGIVNFADFAVFADQWGVSQDIDTLLDFAEQWLKVGLPSHSADIWPRPNGDGRVNASDLAVLADNWLQ
jgi:hypothetical protein